MTTSQRIMKNAGWLIVQPLLLNIISLFVIGFIARTLGQADYGVFVFGFAFAGLFAPFGNLGLGSITVREIARHKEAAPSFFGKILVLKILVVAAVLLLIAAGLPLFGYPGATRTVVLIAAAAMALNAIATSIEDVFQAHEKMRYVAYTNFISGGLLTLLSVAALLAGLRLVGLSLSYLAGAFVALLLAAVFLGRKFFVPRLSFDTRFIRERLAEGAPFFYPTLVSIAGMKLGIILLSKTAGPESVGLYGAASGLVEKLMIIPDGVCAAFYPAMVRAWHLAPAEANVLFRRFFLYLTLLALPIAVGTTILAEPIVLLVYGGQYRAAAPVLQILSWWLFIFFLTSLMGWTMGAIRRERKGAIVPFIVAPCTLLLGGLLIPFLGERGLALALASGSLVALVILARFIGLFLTREFLPAGAFARILAANVFMGTVVVMLRDLGFFAAVGAGLVSYASAVLALKIVGRSDIDDIAGIIIKRGAIAPAGEA